MDNFAVILAGGRGERFWPASRFKRPKQLLKLISNKTMLEETISRVETLVSQDNIIILTGEHLKELIISEIGPLEERNFLIEPVGRNTAPAIGFAAARIIASHGDGIMFVLSSDHLIRPVATFIEALEAAKATAEENDILMLIGIEPSRPETSYGYIEIGDETSRTNGFTAFNVESFKEKPNHLTAQEYYLDNKHLWNSGIFVWRATRIFEEIGKYLPELHSVLMRYIEVVGTPSERAFLDSEFEKLVPISIDYGVLEKSDRVGVLRAKFTWDDVGDYGALERILPKNYDGNVSSGEDTLAVDTYETTILNDSEGAVIAFGVSDLVIVRESDVVLVLHKTRIPQIRELLEKVKNEGMEKYL